MSGSGREAAVSQFAMEEFQGELHGLLRKHRVVAGPFIPQKGVCAIELDPLVICAGLLNRLVNLHTALERNVRILPSPDQ